MLSSCEMDIAASIQKAWESLHRQCKSFYESVPGPAMNFTTRRLLIVQKPAGSHTELFVEWQKGQQQRWFKVPFRRMVGLCDGMLFATCATCTTSCPMRRQHTGIDVVYNSMELWSRSEPGSATSPSFRKTSPGCINLAKRCFPDSSWDTFPAKINSNDFGEVFGIN